MGNAKYIIVEDAFGNEIPIVFSELLVHKDIAEPLLSADKIKKVVSAGFCIWWTTIQEYTCAGESISLKLKSRGTGDSWLVNKHLNIEGK